MNEILQHLKSIIVKEKVRINVNNEEDCESIIGLVTFALKCKEKFGDARTNRQIVHDCTKAHASEKGIAYLTGGKLNTLIKTLKSSKTYRNDVLIEYLGRTLEIEVKSLGTRGTFDYWKSYKYKGICGGRGKSAQGMLNNLGHLDCIIGAVTKKISVGIYDIWIRLVINPKTFLDYEMESTKHEEDKTKPPHYYNDYRATYDVECITFKEPKDAVKPGKENNDR